MIASTSKPQHEFVTAQGIRTKYVEWGDPRGLPLIHLHGSPGSRLERYPDEEVTAALGVRIITFDRPGYGSAKPVANWSLLQCAWLVEELADHLGLDRFMVHAFSGGAPYALATGSHLGSRISAVGILAGLGPIDRPQALEGMGQSNAEAFRLALERPHHLKAFLERDRVAPSIPLSEMEDLAAMPDILEMLLEGHSEMTSQGVAGSLSDYRAFGSEWGFQLGDIAAPVLVWHGEQDSMVPFHHAEYLAEFVPRATLHKAHSRGHFSMFSFQKEVLRSLARVQA